MLEQNEPFHVHSLLRSCTSVIYRTDFTKTSPFEERSTLIIATFNSASSLRVFSGASPSPLRIESGTVLVPGWPLSDPGILQPLAIAVIGGIPASLLYMNSGNVKYGMVGGIAGGIVFGAMMGMMGMLPMIGQMVGFPSPGVGFVVHFFISAFIGATFALLFGSRVKTRTAGLGYGLLYGGIWWILGPLTLMPLMMGMGTAWTLAAATQALPSLMGHLIYGGILGWTYGQLQCRSCAISTIEARPSDRTTVTY